MLDFYHSTGTVTGKLCKCLEYEDVKDDPAATWWTAFIDPPDTNSQASVQKAQTKKT